MMKRRSDGRYGKQVYIGTKDTGKTDDSGNSIVTKEYKTVYGKTKREADDKAHIIRTQLGKGIDISVSTDPFEKWMNSFVECKEMEGLSYSTIYTLKGFCKHLKPIYKLPINRIEIQHLRNIILKLAKDNVDESSGEVIKKALSKRTLSGINHTAKQVFNFAIASRAIDFNPAQFVQIPKDAAISERKPIPKQQQQWIIEFKHRMQLPAMIMLFSGLRRGEVGALTWADINFEEGFITVNKSVEFVNGKPRIKSPKTKAGIRTVDIPTILIDYLRDKKGQDDCMYLVHTRNGTLLSKLSWKITWQSYMKDLNVEYGYTSNQKILMGIPVDKKVSKCAPGGLKIVIEPFTPHQLRHTFATNCYHADVPVEVCRDWMGHANIKTTLDIYTHLSKSYKREKKNKLDEFYNSQMNLG